MKLKILLISRNAWNQTNANTLTNFFQNFEQEELAQIFCRDELLYNPLCKNYFRISERDLLKTIFKRNIHAGQRIDPEEFNPNQVEIKNALAEKRFYDFFRNKRLTLLLWARELIWNLGRWKSPQLRQFIADFNPDVIYTDAYDTFYTYDLLHYVRKQLNKPYVIFHCDDQVTHSRISISPLFWINRWLLRRKVAKAINNAAINYCIIDKQKDLYERIFKRDFKILNKCADFSEVSASPLVASPIKLHFAGNIYYGRWKTLAKLARAIKKLNQNGQKFFLEIYTSNPVSNSQIKSLNIEGASELKGFLPYSKLREVQGESDILVHVESFQQNWKRATALSFSTKLVDYFETGKCILAIGWHKAASIEYLKKHKAAITVTDPTHLVEELCNIYSNQDLIFEFAKNAVNCGNKYHEKSITLNSFRKDLLAIKESSKS